MSEALFQSQGAPYANFKGIGQHYEGVVVRTSSVQSRKYVPAALRAKGVQGELEFWPDQKPKMTPIITIQTDQRDPSIEGDDGQRSLWIKGKSMSDSVKAAVRQAGASRRGIEVGGWLSMTFTHETPPEFDDASPTKHYEVTYRPPAESPQDNINIVGGTQYTQGGSQAPQGAYSGQAAPANQGAYGAPMSQAPSQQGAYSAPAQPPVQEAEVVAPAADPLAGFDLANMTPEARAALQAMLAKQS